MIKCKCNTTGPRDYGWAKESLNRSFKTNCSKEPIRRNESDFHYFHQSMRHCRLSETRFSFYIIRDPVSSTSLPSVLMLLHCIIFISSVSRPVVPNTHISSLHVSLCTCFRNCCRIDCLIELFSPVCSSSSLYTQNCVLRALVHKATSFLLTDGLYPFNRTVIFRRSWSLRCG